MTKIYPVRLTGEVSVPSSKSLSHRYVIAAALAEGKSVIRNVLDSDDLEATKKALKSLGAMIYNEEIIGTKPHVIHDVIDCNESGSTFRFLVPIAMLTNQAVTFIGKGKLGDRPIDVYEEIFKPSYIFIHPQGLSLPLTVKGPLKANNYHLIGNISSQFLTGLLLALPLVEGDSTITLTTELESKGYIDLTLDVLKRFGIEIKSKENQYFIPGSQSYRPVDLSVEGDYSSAAFYIVAGTIGSKILIKGLNPDSLQGDRKIIDILKAMNGKLSFTNEGLMVSPIQTKGTTIDLKDIPDLGPILMLLASLSKGITIFKNVSRLRIKESDRLSAMIDSLSSLGVKLELRDDELMIEGQDRLYPSKALKSYGDHRIAMTLAIASIRCSGPLIIDDISVVKKSYPDFFKDFIKLGGKIE